MPHMDFVGWIVVGFLAGALSGAVVERGPRGCLANTVVGILGGLLGGWFATEEMHMDSTRGFLGALLVAFLGAVVIRLLLDALDSDDRRSPAPPTRHSSRSHYPIEPGPTRSVRLDISTRAAPVSTRSR